jgi:hypothetical protein
MKRLPARRRRGPITRADQGVPPGWQDRDRLVFIAFLITGVVLVSACHYSLAQLSAFYGLIVAAQAAERNRYVD